jgi:hypothetical protein
MIADRSYETVFPWKSGLRILSGRRHRWERRSWRRYTVVKGQGREKCTNEDGRGRRRGGDGTRGYMARAIEGEQLFVALPNQLHLPNTPCSSFPRPFCYIYQDEIQPVSAVDTPSPALTHSHCSSGNHCRAGHRGLRNLRRKAGHLIS